MLLPGFRHLHERGQEIEALGKKKAVATERVRQHERQKKELSTDAGIERVARDELHYAKPGETIFVFEKKPRLAREVNPGAPGERRP
jgi:cell division protein FtsB